MLIGITITVVILLLLLIGLIVRVNALEEHVAKQQTYQNDMLTVLQAHDKYLHFLSEQSPKTEALQSYYDSIKGVA